MPVKTGIHLKPFPKRIIFVMDPGFRRDDVSTMLRAMRAPDFWYRKNSALARLLQPLGWLYDALGKFWRMRITPEKIGIPVVCIGNVTLGGSGKTPVVAELARRLRALGCDAHILSRGYGGSAAGPLRVDPALHKAYEVGDEPLLLSDSAPVWVAKDKLAGAKAAEAGGAKLLLLDDGLQNPHLRKDFSLLVLDQAGLGNGRIFPAGPLREKLGDALLRVNGVIYLGNDPLPMEIARRRLIFLRAVPQTMSPVPVKGKTLLAFCGIGRPEKFFDGLAEQGARLAAHTAFPDHYSYSLMEAQKLLSDAEKLKALPVTTDKDATRLPPSLLPRFAVCSLRLLWQDEPAFNTLLRKIHELCR